jgi:S-formylglutathione hydrolase FrmB
MGRQDEKDFLDIVEAFDRAMHCGELPPMIVIVPDGSFRGRPPLLTAGSFFINSKAGKFEDYLVFDIWDFVRAHFPIRPERDAHVLMGASMGGFASYNLGIKHQDRFKIVAGIFPSLNVRWVDCPGRYNGNFDPNCWGWREDFRPYELITCYRGVPVLMKHFTDPIFGRGPDIVHTISAENPIEMLTAYDVQPGQLDMFVGYGGKDDLNIDAQAESFLFVARERGLEVEVSYLPDGRHDLGTLLRLLPDLFRWLAPKLAPFAPK